MIIDVYRSTSDSEKYLSVPNVTDITQLKLPEDSDPDLFNLSPFKSGLELNPDQPVLGFNQKDIENQINEKGFAIHGATMQVSINLTGSL